MTTNRIDHLFKPASDADPTPFERLYVPMHDHIAALRELERHMRDEAAREVLPLLALGVASGVFWAVVVGLIAFGR